MEGWAVAAAAGTLVSSALLVLPDRRSWWFVGAMLQYGLASVLAAGPNGFQVAAVMFVGGVLAIVILWMSVRDLGNESTGSDASLVGRIGFRVVALCLVLTVGWGAGRAEWIHVAGLLPAARAGATMMLAVGLMQVGLFDHALRVGIGVLTLISGFQVIYSVIEPSLAVLALLTLVHLGIAITFGYLAQVEQAAPADHPVQP